MLFIRTSLDVVQSVITTATPQLLNALQREPFAFIGRAYVGQLQAPPSCWIMPRNTVFADDEQSLAQVDALTVKIGVTGGDPELVVDAALDYVRAVGEALENARPGAIDPTIKRIFVTSHDYGPLFEKGTAFARFPELHLAIEREELYDDQ